ncbi:MAG: DUF4097 family beta strand repeat-containing protein [Myxococcota bacterium]
MENSAECGRRGGGFGDFLRSLLSGIPWSEKAESTETFRFDSPRAGGLRIDNANGLTRVLGEERDDVLVEAHKVARAESEEGASRLLQDIRVESSQVGGSLELEVVTPGRWNRRGRVDLEVRVPRRLEVEVNASNGRVALCGLRAGVRVRSSNGKVRLEDLVGDADITATNALVSCRCTRGRVTARSSNGNIKLEEHRGAVDASTSNGLISVALEELAPDGVQLATSNGRIVLELPDEVDGDVDLRVDNGVIRNARTLCRCTRDTSGRVRGTLGAGGAPIRLRTSNGSISLR